MNRIIAKRILNKYASYMGDYFDYIQGNEEEMQADAIALVKQAPLWAKIKMLIYGEVK
jgi:hypothetical protein